MRTDSLQRIGHGRPYGANRARNADKTANNNNAYPPGYLKHRRTHHMTYESDFIDAYIECALWADSANVTINDDGTIIYDPGNDQSFTDHNFDSDDLTAEARAAIAADCLAFITENPAVRTLDPAQSGHDFHLTRNHHGTGFWDRGYGPLGDDLTQAAHAHREASLFVNATGTIGFDR